VSYYLICCVLLVWSVMPLSWAKVWWVFSLHSVCLCKSTFKSSLILWLKMTLSILTQKKSSLQVDNLRNNITATKYACYFNSGNRSHCFFFGQTDHSGNVIIRKVDICLLEWISFLEKSVSNVFFGILMFIRPVFLLSLILKIVNKDNYFCHVHPSFWLSVCLSVCPYGTTGQIFKKFNVWIIFENLSTKYKFHRNLSRITMW